MTFFVRTALAVLIPSCGVYAQITETTVCDVLANPPAFNGKDVRIKGEVVAGFEEFAIRDTSCKQDVNAIWLAYPEGTKGKAGAVAMVSLQISRQPAGQSVNVKLDRNKDFKQFDSALAEAGPQRNGMCLGCGRNTVTATLTGHVDGVASAGLFRNEQGKFSSVQGFGHLSRYRARLILEQVVDVQIRPVDFSSAVSSATDRPGQGGAGDPFQGVKSAATSFAVNSAPYHRLQAAVSAFGAPGEQNGVLLSFGKVNEIPATDNQTISPDNLVIRVLLDMDRLKDQDALSSAISHMGTHIADMRDASKSTATPFSLEWRAWETTVWRVFAAHRAGLVAPGGTIAWSCTWSGEETGKLVDQNITRFLVAWCGLAEKNPHNPWPE